MCRSAVLFFAANIPLDWAPAKALRLLCLDVGREDHLFNAFPEIPALNYLVAVFLVLDDDIGESGLCENFLQFLHGNRSRDSAAVGIYILLYSL